MTKKDADKLAAAIESKGIRARAHKLQHWLYAVTVGENVSLIKIGFICQEVGLDFEMLPSKSVEKDAARNQYLV